MPDRERKRVPDHRSDVLKNLSPRVLLPVLGTRKIRVSEASEESVRQSRDKQLRERCTRDNVEADESYVVLDVMTRLLFPLEDTLASMGMH